jgi:probable phosphoglycerate mutase
LARLVFARHGQSTANLTRTFANRSNGFPLTELGVRQASELANSLLREPFARVLHSPLQRARQTAEVVARTLGVPLAARESLREWDVGDREGSSDQAGWDEYSAVTAAWATGDASARMRGGESLAEIRERTLPLFEELQSDLAAGQSVLCIAHGGIYRAALPGWLPNVTLAWVMASDFPNSGTVVVELEAGLPVCRSWCGQSSA